MSPTSICPDSEGDYYNSAEQHSHLVAGATVCGYDNGRSDVLCHRSGVLLHASSGHHEVRTTIGVAAHRRLWQSTRSADRRRKLLGCSGNKLINQIP